MKNDTTSFHQRREEMWRVASMLEAMAHDITKASQFLAEEAGRMAEAEKRFAERAERRGSSQSVSAR